MWTITAFGPNLPLVQKSLSPCQTLFVGRALDNGVLLPADYVSRRHVQLTTTEHGLRACDLGTRNGTLLNGHPVGTVSRPVESGDVLQVGDYKIKVEQDPAAPRPQPDGFITLQSCERDANPLTTRVGFDASVVAGGTSRYAPLLFEIAARMASESDELILLAELLDYAQAATGFEGVVLLKDRLEEFVPLPVPGSEVVAQWSTTIVRAAVSRASTLLVSHLPSDPRFAGSQSLELAQPLRVICAPMQTCGVTAGAMYLWTRKAELPDAEALHFIGALSQLGAVALRRHGWNREEPTTAPAEPVGLEAAVRFAEHALASVQPAPLGETELRLLADARAALAILRSRAVRAETERAA